MNNKRRNKLNDAIALLNKASDIIDSVVDEENDALCNTPENLQGSDAYCRREEVIDDLDDASTNICEAVSQIERATCA